MDKTTFAIFVALFAAILIFAETTLKEEKAIAVEAIKNGLQQCLVKVPYGGIHIVWKKECEKGE